MNRTLKRLSIHLLAPAVYLSFSLPLLAQPSAQELAGPPADAKVSETGLASKVLVAGDGEYHPDGNDHVAVFFTGWTLEGVQFLDN